MSAHVCVCICTHVDVSIDRQADRPFPGGERQDFTSPQRLCSAGQESTKPEGSLRRTRVPQTLPAAPSELGFPGKSTLSAEEGGVSPQVRGHTQAAGSRERPLWAGPQEAGLPEGQAPLQGPSGQRQLWEGHVPKANARQRTNPQRDVVKDAHKGVAVRQEGRLHLVRE